MPPALKNYPPLQPQRGKICQCSEQNDLQLSFGAWIYFHCFHTKHTKKHSENCLLVMIRRITHHALKIIHTLLQSGAMTGRQSEARFTVTLFVWLDVWLILDQRNKTNRDQKGLYQLRGCIEIEVRLLMNFKHLASDRVKGREFLLNTSSVLNATSSFIHLKIHLTSVNQVAVLQRRMMFTAQVNMRRLEVFQGTTCRLQDGTGALQVRYNVQGCSRLFDPRFCS